MVTEKKWMLLSGLPRTAATALGSIFAQNPDVHFGGHSPLVPLLHGIKESVDGNARENLVMLNKHHGFKEKAMRNMAEFYYEDVSLPCVIDKGRSWCCEANRRYAKECLGENVRHVILVRPIDEVVSSFAALRKKNGWTGDIFSDLLEDGTDPIIWPFNGIIYSKFMDFQDTLFVSFDDIIYNTQKTVSDIANFVGFSEFNYSFSNIKEAVSHNDAFLQLDGLHDVRGTLSVRDHQIDLPAHIKELCGEYNQRMIDVGINLKLSK